MSSHLIGTVNVEATIYESILATLDSKSRTSVVVDSEGKLVGIVSEGDLLRAYLKGFQLNTTIIDVMNPNPFFVNKALDKVELLELWRKTGIETVPVIDEERKLLTIQRLRDEENWIIS